MTNINEENIRVAAYYIWEQAGRPEGAESDCWFKACEQFLTASKKKAAQKSTTKKPVVSKTVSKPAAKPAVKTVAKPTPAAKKPAASKTPFYGVKK